jgi:hypothetical protein
VTCSVGCKGGGSASEKWKLELHMELWREVGLLEIGGFGWGKLGRRLEVLIRR